MERDIFPKDEVYSQLKEDFVLVAQYTDDPKDPVPAQKLSEYTGGGSFAVPLYIVADHNGKEIARFVPPTNIASLSSKEFAEFLRNAKQKYASRN